MSDFRSAHPMRTPCQSQENIAECLISIWSPRRSSCPRRRRRLSMTRTKTATEPDRRSSTLIRWNAMCYQNEGELVSQHTDWYFTSGCFRFCSASVLLLLLDLVVNGLRIRFLIIGRCLPTKHAYAFLHSLRYAYLFLILQIIIKRCCCCCFWFLWPTIWVCLALPAGEKLLWNSSPAGF